MSRRLLIAADWVFAYLHMGVRLIIEVLTSWVFWGFIIALILYVGVTR